MQYQKLPSLCKHYCYDKPLRSAIFSLHFSLYHDKNTQDLYWGTNGVLMARQVDSECHMTASRKKSTRHYINVNINGHRALSLLLGQKDRIWIIKISISTFNTSKCTKSYACVNTDGWWKCIPYGCGGILGGRLTGCGGMAGAGRGCSIGTGGPCVWGAGACGIGTLTGAGLTGVLYSDLCARNSSCNITHAIPSFHNSHTLVKIISSNTWLLHITNPGLQWLYRQYIEHSSSCFNYLLPEQRDHVVNKLCWGNKYELFLAKTEQFRNFSILCIKFRQQWLWCTVVLVFNFKVY